MAALYKEYIERRSRIVVGMDIGMRYNDAFLQMKRRFLALGLGPGIHKAIRGELRLAFKQWPRAWQKQAWVAGREEGS